MSEDDRAAKAARAKALLKKRQAKKSGAPAIASPPASPSLRAYSPAPSELPAVTGEQNDFGDVFSKSDSDTNWLASLPRIENPPSRPPSRPPSTAPPFVTKTITSPPTSSPLVNGSQTASSLQELADLRSSLHHREETISQLQSENTSFMVSLEQLQNLQAKCKQTEFDLEGERTKSQEYDSKVQKLAADLQITHAKVFELTTREKEVGEKTRADTQNLQQTISLLVSEKASLTASLDHLEGLESDLRDKDELLESERVKTVELNTRVSQAEAELEGAREKHRDQERELQLTDGTVAELRGLVDQHQRRVQELEEHIQSDDRAEKLEQSLKHTQERADELEFQLSKLKQAHDVTTSERENIEAQLQSYKDSNADWTQKHSALESQQFATGERLAVAIANKEALAREKATLQSDFDRNQGVLSEFEQKLAAAASELVASARQLQIAQSELRIANRRADEAEKTQKDLQSEGTRLMRSLDEMRPKIVELTGDKIELGNKVDSLNHALRKRDAVIAELESTLDELRDNHDQAIKSRDEGDAQRHKDNASSQTGLTELQKAYSELESGLEEAKAGILELEAERISHHQIATRQVEEIDRLTASSQIFANEATALKQRLTEQTRLGQEDRGFIERAQEEVELLRNDLAAAEEEIERLRDEASAPENGARGSLDAEMLGSVKQEYSLELSNAQSRIRTLETSVYDAQAKSHLLQKRVNLLEEQLANPSRSSSRVGSRPSSRAHNHAQSNDLPPLARSVFDIGLTPETRHKRRVSLSMLKARIDSETASNYPPTRPGQKRRPSSLSTVYEPSSDHLHMDIGHQRSQLDESHIFWCSSCKADLIIL